MDQSLLKALANRLNLTNLDEEKEDYILTEDEERLIIEHEISSLKKHKAWKMLDKGVKEEQIALKISLINWDEEVDMEEVLKRANSNKLYGIWQKEQRIKEYELEAQKKAELQTRCTAKYMFNLMAWTSENIYRRKLIVNEDTIPLIKVMCLFLSRDEKFETGLGYSFKKGLLIRGISGLGKSYIIDCVKSNDLQPISVYSMIEIAKIIKEEGEFILPYNSGNIIYLDDVGTEEPTINYYGTKINFFKDFIEVYYQYIKTYNKLIISTNNNFSEIEEKYGFRVRSRMKDMFNIVDVKGQDLRGLNFSNDNNK